MSATIAPGGESVHRKGIGRFRPGTRNPSAKAFESRVDRAAASRGKPRYAYPIQYAGAIQFRSAPSLELCALWWFEAGIDTAFAARFLDIDESHVAGALARARDISRASDIRARAARPSASEVPPVRSAGHGVRDCPGLSSLDFGRPGSSEPAPAVLLGDRS